MSLFPEGYKDHIIVKQLIQDTNALVSGDIEDASSFLKQAYSVYYYLKELVVDNIAATTTMFSIPSPINSEMIKILKTQIDDLNMETAEVKDLLLAASKLMKWNLELQPLEKQKGVYEQASWFLNQAYEQSSNKNCPIEEVDLFNDMAERLIRINTNLETNEKVKLTVKSLKQLRGISERMLNYFRFLDTADLIRSTIYKNLDYRPDLDSLLDNATDPIKEKINGLKTRLCLDHELNDKIIISDRASYKRIMEHIISELRNADEELFKHTEVREVLLRINQQMGELESNLANYETAEKLVSDLSDALSMPPVPEASRSLPVSISEASSDSPDVHTHKEVAEVLSSSAEVHAEEELPPSIPQPLSSPLSPAFVEPSMVSSKAPEENVSEEEPILAPPSSPLSSSLVEASSASSNAPVDIVPEGEPIPEPPGPPSLPGTAEDNVLEAASIPVAPSSPPGSKVSKASSGTPEAEVPKTPSKPSVVSKPSGPGRGDLLSQIAGGVKLRSRGKPDVQTGSHPKVEVSKPDDPFAGVRKAFSNYAREVIKQDDDLSDDEWGEEKKKGWIEEEQSKLAKDLFSEKQKVTQRYAPQTAPILDKLMEEKKAAGITALEDDIDRLIKKQEKEIARIHKPREGEIEKINQNYESQLLPLRKALKEKELLPNIMALHEQIDHLKKNQNDEIRDIEELYKYKEHLLSEFEEDLRQKTGSFSSNSSFQQYQHLRQEFITEAFELKKKNLQLQRKLNELKQTQGLSSSSPFEVWKSVKTYEHDLNMNKLTLDQIEMKCRVRQSYCINNNPTQELREIRKLEISQNYVKELLTDQYEFEIKQKESQFNRDKELITCNEQEAIKVKRKYELAEKQLKLDFDYHSTTKKRSNQLKNDEIAIKEKYEVKRRGLSDEQQKKVIEEQEREINALNQTHAQDIRDLHTKYFEEWNMVQTEIDSITPKKSEAKKAEDDMSKLLESRLRGIRAEMEED